MSEILNQSIWFQTRIQLLNKLGLQGQACQRHGQRLLMLSWMKSEDQLYVFGGEYPFGEEPKRTTDTWTSGTPLPTARHGLAAIAINETIYVISGWTRTKIDL